MGFCGINRKWLLRPIVLLNKLHFTLTARQVQYFCIVVMGTSLNFVLKTPYWRAININNSMSHFGNESYECQNIIGLYYCRSPVCDRTSKSNKVNHIYYLTSWVVLSTLLLSAECSYVTRSIHNNEYISTGTPGKSKTVDFRMKKNLW